MNLTTLERVITLDTQLPDQKDHAMINMIIAAVSSKIQTYLGRTIQKGTYTEYFDIAKFSETAYKLKAYPVTRDAEIEPGVPNPLKVMNYDEEFVSTQYRLNYNDGRLSLSRDGIGFDAFTEQTNSALSSAYLVNAGLEALEVTYHGGMALDTADFITKYPDIEYEVILQVLFDYKRKKNITMETVGAGGNSSEAYLPFELRPELKRALRPYRNATGVA